MSTQDRNLALLSHLARNGDQMASILLEAHANNVADKIKTKYLLAGYNRVHMEIDYEGLDLIPYLSDGATQAEANTRANVLKAALLSHMVGVGTIYVDGEHPKADTVNAAILSVVPLATDFDTCRTLIVALLAGIIGHSTDETLHFNPDHGAGGTTAVVGTDPPIELIDAIGDLNTLQDAMILHNSLGSE